jgi:phosphatidate cytidylyltransferase
MKRLATAAVGTPLLLAATFLLPEPAFLAVAVLVIDWAVLEYVQMARAWAPGAPLRSLLVLVPGVAVGLVLLTPVAGGEVPQLLPLGAALLLSAGIAVLVMLGRTPLPVVVPALGTLAFGIPYFALGLFAIGRLQQIDPWLLFLGYAVVFFGDAAAYYVGSAVGRHKMAPTVSPNKSWEGSAASFVTALVAAAVWGWLRLGEVTWPLLVLGAATSVAAQLGDLVESMLKRSSGVKDSGSLLPGHGGMWDRTDALLFALPVLLLGAMLIGPQHLVP